MIGTFELQRHTAAGDALLKGNLVGRIYPNGEFGYSYLRDYSVDELLDSIESTNVPNSHTDHETRTPKGRNGISSYSRRQVRNAAEAIQMRFGKSNCTFATVTLPSLEDSDYIAVLENWSEVVRQFMQKLKRFLQSCGMPSVAVGVVEIQTKRMRREQRFLPLHLHFVFPGKKPSGHWVVTPQLVRKYWADAIRNASGVDVGRYSWDNSENLQQVKMSAANYLGKYMSKGRQDLQEVEAMGLSDLLPSHWSTCSQSLKNWIKNNTHEGFEIGKRLAEVVEGQPQLCTWRYDIKLTTEDGRSVPIGVCGLLNPMGRTFALFGLSQPDYATVPAE